MTTVAWVFVGAAAVFALLDWVAVARDRLKLEYVAKPATMVALIGAALALTPADATQRGWWVAALAACLAGDVFLMLPGRFVPGLAAFLLGHLAYIAGFWLGPAAGASPAAMLAAVLPIAVVAGLIGPTIVKGARQKDPRLTGPVLNYVVVISAMVASAVLTGQPLAIAGAALFFASDGMIGFRNFVEHKPWMDLAVIVTYHAGQVLLVLSLL